MTFIDGHEFWQRRAEFAGKSVAVHGILQVYASGMATLYLCRSHGDEPPMLLLRDHGVLSQLVWVWRGGDIIGGGSLAFQAEAYVQGVVGAVGDEWMMRHITYCRVGSLDAREQTELIGGKGLCVGVGTGSGSPISRAEAKVIVRGYLDRVWNGEAVIDRARSREVELGWLYRFGWRHGWRKLIHLGAPTGLVHTDPLLVTRRDGLVHALSRRIDMEEQLRSIAADLRTGRE